MPDVKGKLLADRFLLLRVDFLARNQKQRDCAIPVLATLVAQYGPPLVLKSDNGSVFISQRFAEWLTARQIVPLFSPVRMPRYSGACEASIGGMQRRTEHIAARSDRLLHWTCDDLFAASSGPTTITIRKG